MITVECNKINQANQPSSHTPVADKEYDSEKNHITAYWELQVLFLQDTKMFVYNTRGYHRKMLKRQGYDSMTYHQRNKT